MRIVRTNTKGYFTVNRSSKSAIYRFTAYSDSAASQLIGNSRSAKSLE